LTNPRARQGSKIVEQRSVRKKRKPLRYIAAALIAMLGAFGAATARWFVWPQQGMSDRVDAIVMLNGPGNRLDTALELAWAHRASTIVISQGSKFWDNGNECVAKIPHVTVICFVPNPPTTRGEAEFAGRLAARYHWHSMVVVATTPQDTVARIRVSRCFSGKLYAVNAPLSETDRLYGIAYYWGATIEALFLQRSC
jgi:hypothetical protein